MSVCRGQHAVAARQPSWLRSGVRAGAASCGSARRGGGGGGDGVLRHAGTCGAILTAAGCAWARCPFALVPAFTFITTAVAAETCGYAPFLADIDPESWVLDPVRLAVLDLSRVGLVIPVAPFCRRVAQAPWLAFQRETGISVVIDAAASFETLLWRHDDSLGIVPIALSFHATKSFGLPAAHPTGRCGSGTWGAGPASCSTTWPRTACWTASTVPAST